MRRRRPEGEDPEPSLFDLPLDLPDHDRLEPLTLEDEEEEGRELAAAPPPQKPRPAPRPVPAPVAERLAPVPPAPRRPQPAPDPAAPAPHDRPGPGSRLAAGLADLLVHAAITAVALAGARFLGATPTLDQWPPLAIFLLSFSFLYTVLPLAFWGQTLGMTWAGLLAKNRDDEPLTFDQTARRWLGGLLTTATAGLPILLAGRKRTLTDLLSGSKTFRVG
jgi:uncharacterized RDD family membrane protein YckC